MPPLIAELATSDPDFYPRLDALLAFEAGSDQAVADAVAAILAAVKAEGDAALLRFTNKFDRRDCASVAALEIPLDACRRALAELPSVERQALELAADRVRRYHRRQLQQSWSYREDDGTLLGQQVTAMARVGIYVPGGKASYPSSVLMNAIPAKVAGVDEVVMVVPAPGGELNPLVLAAAALAGVDRVFTVGGAQAVAALAYGTETLPRVDKIVGPGNVYVASAKRAVFGTVAIDMIAGPSEILVVCDGHTDPDWIAMDLCSQAEHDELAQAILISPDREFLACVRAALARLVPDLQRAAIAGRSLADRGALIAVRSLDEAMDLVNRIAPEHLELSVADPEQWLPKIRHAGAIFLGRHTPEALGDYCAGPNHVLPTSGTARFSSPLGVYDFQKRSSLIYCSPQGASALGKCASVLARAESLEAHARSAEYRIQDK